jgi:hypothetical protein
LLLQHEMAANVALGHLRPSQSTPISANVRYAPNSDHSRHQAEMTRSANRDRRTAAISISTRSPLRRWRAALMRALIKRGSV